MVIKEKDRKDHMSKHYNEAESYLTSSMCKHNKHIFYFKFKTNKCRLCVYLHRYRVSCTMDIFKDHYMLKYLIFEMKFTIFGYYFFIFKKGGKCLCFVMNKCMRVVVDKTRVPIRRAIWPGSYTRKACREMGQVGWLVSTLVLSTTEVTSAESSSHA